MNRIKILKSALFSLAMLLISVVGLAKDSVGSVEKLWQSANEAYTQNDYKLAIDNYEKIRKEGFESAKLYYNLANAYFKIDEIGMAIVNYKRAERLDPMDEDIVYNLAIADAQTVNHIEPLPEFVLFSWYKGLRGLLSANQWAWLSIFWIVMMFSAAMFYLLSNTPLKRKGGFTLSLISLIFFTVTLVFSINRKNVIVDSNEAVVLSSGEAVKSSPDDNGKDLFVIGEGAVVKIVDSIGKWSEIVVASGNKGWILTKAIEVI